MKEYQSDARRGLYYLGSSTKHYIGLEDCGLYIHPIGFHPLGQMSKAEARRPDNERIFIIRAEDPDRSFEAFIAHFRYLTKSTTALHLRKLRVITMDSPHHPDQRYVFFEAWIKDKILISDGIADSRVAGHSLRMKYEDVFALLSKVFDIDVKRIGLAVPAPIAGLRRLTKSVVDHK